MRRQKPEREPTMEMRRREGARDVPSQAPAAATETQEDSDMFGFKDSIDATPESVRALHGVMYRRLRRHMELHRSILTDDAWKLLTRVAFALYVDSLRANEEVLTIAELAPEPPERRTRVTARRR